MIYNREIGLVVVNWKRGREGLVVCIARKGIYIFRIFDKNSYSPAGK